jgi:ketosteroid isomerase-like protein
MDRPVHGFGCATWNALRHLALPVVAILVSCHPRPLSNPTFNDADAKTVLGFLHAYGRRDLDGMMRYLEEDAVFRGSGDALSKSQIRDFFQASFQKHPNLLVEVGPLKDVQGTIHASVKVQTNAIWADTWIFEMRNHKIRAYSLASSRR